ncbi:MAG: hypothetical protein GY722_25445, partial [bacterium]|nr:hypothetical protein [bacterium]
GAGSGPVGLIAFNNIESLSFNPFTGELYGTHRRDPSQEDLLFRLDPDIGNHLAGVFGGDDYVLIEKQDPYYHAADMAFDPTDGQAYIVHWDLNGHWTIATLDPTAGATATMWPAPADIASLAFDETGRLFTSTETGSQENLYELNKANGSLLSSIVIDNGGAYEAMAIAFPVEANRPPVFDQDLQNRTDPEGTSVSLSASATDPDAGHSVGYSATGLPPGLSIDPGNGLISGTIAYTGDGTYSVEITARDDGIPNLSSVDTFDWTVTELNQPPVFDQDLPDRIDAEGSVISLPSPATDPDNADILTYGAVGLPPGLSIDTGTGLISGTIDYTAAAASPHAVIITSTDDGAPNESAVPDTFSWTVSNTNRPPVFDGPGAQTTPELAPFTVTLTATDPDGQVPSFSDTGTLPAWAMLTDNGDGSATISGTPGVGDSGTTTITVTASDGGSPDLSDSATFDITVTNTNMPPTITNPGNQTGSENSPFSLTISASDLDGTTVSFSDADTLPDWATLTDNGDDTATISGTPDYDDAMTTTVTITASDGLLNDDAVFDITISNTNRAPLVASIGDQSVAENNPFSLAVSAIDPDGTTPALSGSGLPGWASFADNGDGTGTITGTPGYNDAAVITVTVTAFDGTLFDNTDFDLTVTNTNRAPVVAPVADQLVAEGIALTPVVVSSSDPDGTTPALAATGLPGWASFTDNGDGTGTITGTPGYNDAAATTVTINAEDGGVPNLADSTSFTLTVTETNRAPVANPVVDQSVAEASAIAPIDVSASDPDGTIPALSATDLPGWASFTDNGDGTGTITGTPGYNDAAVTTVTINASDGDLADTTTFTITVTDTNRSPLISTISDQTLVEGDPLTLSLSASDPDGAAPSLSAVGLPSWATLVDNGDGTGSISGTPAFGDAGISTVTVTASDGSLTDETTFKLTVTAGNRSPVFDTTLSDRTDAEGVSVALDAAATDPDGDPITYAATGLPPGIVIAPITGAITGTLSYDAAGSHPVTVTVTDNGTPILDASQSFVWTVTNTNRAPILVPIPPILGPEQTDLTFTAVANDPDGGTITYSLAGAPAGATIAPDSGVFSWIPSEAQGEGSYAFTVIATDDGSPALTDTKTVTITVAEVNLPPTVDPIGDQQNDQGDLVELVVVATDPDVPLNTFTFAASGLPAGLTIHPTTGTIFGSISAGASGAHDVTVTVTDNGIPPRSGTTSFKWLVGDTNHPPEMDRLSDRTVAEHSPVTIRPVTTDPDGDSLRYEVAGAPPGSTFDPDTGTLRWIPSEEQGPGT